MLRQRVQGGKDAVREQLNKLYDDVLSLKEMIGRLTDENQKLEEQLEESKQFKPTIQQVGETSYYFLNDEGLFCQRCFDAEKRE